jgi:glycosyltransferase involved in cell wall biosynthesis
MDQCFGTADFYSHNLKKLGHEAAEVVANCRPLQMRWAREHGIKARWKWSWRAVGPLRVPSPRRPDWTYAILQAQIKAWRPDVVHFQDPNAAPAAFLREIRPHVRLLTAQIASPYSPRADFSPYDLMLSSFPHYVKRFNEQGLRGKYFRLGFEPRVLQRVKRTALHDAVFVGGFSRAHAERIRFFEDLARRFPIDWWGYGVDNLNVDSPLRAAWRGPAWALEMYGRLHNARIAVNHHIDAAENFANNMRLYEATGAGAMLLTDAKDNLRELFEPGKEVIAYRSAEECAERIRYYLDHEAERAAIAKAGQERTLREHTYLHRMREYLEIIQKLLSGDSVRGTG